MSPRSLNEIVDLLRAPHGAGKPAQCDAADMLEAQAIKIEQLIEALAQAEFLIECHEHGGP